MGLHEAVEQLRTNRARAFLALTPEARDNFVRGLRFWDGERMAGKLADEYWQERIKHLDPQYEIRLTSCPANEKDLKDDAIRLKACLPSQLEERDGRKTKRMWAVWHVSPHPADASLMVSQIAWVLHDGNGGYVPVTEKTFGDSVTRYWAYHGGADPMQRIRDDAERDTKRRAKDVRDKQEALGEQMDDEMQRVQRNRLWYK